MSKAFTKETDHEDEPNQPEQHDITQKNYVTPKGLMQLQIEYKKLLYNERPEIVEKVKWAAGNGDRSENGDYIYGKKRLREIDRRLRYLKKRLDHAHLVDPALQKNLTKIHFGARVTYLNAADKKISLQIVGIDEADLKENTISWISPVAKALLNAEVGDIVKIKTPKGVEKVEVIAIVY